MIPEPCPACGWQMEPVTQPWDWDKTKQIEIAKKCYRCNIRFDYEKSRHSERRFTIMDSELAISNWNDVCRRLREMPFQ